MGLSTKQVVSGDQELDWSWSCQSFLQSGSTLELPKPARRQQNPPQSEPVKCPRCDSTNTKFCYYNNYNKSQPRHYCRACKRHWTKGGTLRNVPVGGGRKNKRIKRPNSAAPAAANRTKNQSQPQPQPQNFPLGLDDSQNDTIAKILGNNNGGFQNQGIQFLFSSLSNFDTNPSSIPCFELPMDYKYESKLEAMEDPAITNVMANRSSSSIVNENQAWEVPSTSGVMDHELANYWNWNEMVSADLNIPWEDDDTEIERSPN